MDFPMMIRDDLSNKLIHLTKGGNKNNPDFNKAAINFIKMVSERKLIGSPGILPGKIYSENKCVCFSEAPISKLATILSNPNVFGMKYAPFGIMFDKKWLFKNGGRPVIYQPDSEYKNLPESHRYRHVTFNIDPNKDEKYVDFTFEREWRINTDDNELNGELNFETEDVTLIVPDRSWENKIINNWLEFWNMRKMIDDGLRETEDMLSHSIGVEGYNWIDFPWHILVLEDLGVSIQVPDTILNSNSLEHKFFFQDETKF